jgi:hypothetical protein
MKQIFAKGDQYVWIKTGPVTWSSLPTSVRVALTRGIERISEQRKQITKGSKLAQMPPVEVVTEIWMKGYTSIDGTVGPVHAPDGFYLRVRLPAQITLCEDSEIVRGILVHEFLHIFHYFTEHVVGLVDRSAPEGSFRMSPEGFDPFNAEHDDKELADPADWLGEQDAASLLRHDSVAGAAIHATIGDYADHFRKLVPNTNVDFKGSLHLDESTLDRAREIVRRRSLTAKIESLAGPGHDGFG